jgi:hypothetical protein
MSKIFQIGICFFILIFSGCSKEVSYTKTTYGPFSDAYLAKRGDEKVARETSVGDNYGFYYEKAEKWYFHVNGNTEGPYSLNPHDNRIHPTISHLFISKNNWAYEYQDDSDNYYAVVNGQKYGPYSLVHFSIGDENWGFVFKKIGDEKNKYVNLMGEEYGPFENVTLTVSANNWGYRYNKDEQSFVNIKGEEFGPYEYQMFENLFLTDKRWAIKYYTNWERAYLVLDGEVEGPYGSVFAPTVFKDHYGISVKDIHNDSRTIRTDQEDFKYEYEAGDVLVNDTLTIFFGESDRDEIKAIVNGKVIDCGSYRSTYHYSEDYIIFACSKYNRENNQTMSTVYLNGEKHENHKGHVRDIRISEKNWAYHLMSDEEDGESYVYVNGSKQGPFQYVEDIMVFEGGWGIVHKDKKDGEYFVDIYQAKYKSDKNF